MQSESMTWLIPCFLNVLKFPLKLTIKSIHLSQNLDHKVNAMFNDAKLNIY